jgi:glutamate dehydrogenase
MPQSYFKQTSHTTRVEHVKAVAALKDSDMDLSMNLKSKLSDGRRVMTFIRPENKRGLLLNLLPQLPKYTDKDLSRVQLYTMSDNSMCLNMFTYGEGNQTSGGTSGGADRSRLIDKILASAASDPDCAHSEDEIRAFTEKCTSGYLNNSVSRRFLKQMELYNRVSGTEGVAVSIEPYDAAEHTPADGVGALESNHDAAKLFWVDTAIANSLPQYALEHFARVMQLQEMDIIRTHLDNVPDGEGRVITMLRMLVNVEDNEITPKLWERVTRNIKRFKWIDPLTADLILDKYPFLGVRRGEIITAMCSLMHPIMSKTNAVAYSKANIVTAVTSPQHIQYASEIADLFIDKFNPETEKYSMDAMIAKADVVRKRVNDNVQDGSANALLNKMVDVVLHTYRTNLFMENRYSLGFRLDPAIMAAEGEERTSPFGVVFAHGRRFNGYHVRFRDIARGGLRIVTPGTAEQLALESGRHYDECYGLAFAQQMKNKDIPEGGSKCVCLVDAVGMSPTNKNFVMRKSLKAFTDTILDLIVDTPETNANVKDYYNLPEVLYLGPDEQVIPDDINWVIQRAKYRGYSIPNAFMSSKPAAGINHKVYGVTSEGVNVFLEVALNETLNINPRSNEFSIKMTGGTDGDVCGNEILILFREYGDNAKIVGLCDHTGSLEDPNGLDREELTRMVKDSVPLNEFDTSKLSSEGRFHSVDNEEGLRMRNTMHNRVVADAFIPAGGRPNTIDINNWKQFLKPDGTPSSSLIVEGANLFSTLEARKAMYEQAGIIIVKDSSANKCGVICSSYEICAAMLLSEEEFLDNKEEIVNDVLVKLRHFAKVEAELLFREFNNYPGALPDFSGSISDTINAATDAVRDALQDAGDDELEGLMGLVKTHLPKKMADMAFDRCKDNLPHQYLLAAIASSLASKMVYQEGVNFVKSQPKENLSKLALKYIQVEKEIYELEAALAAGDMSDEQRARVMDLVHRGGVRTSLNIF